MPRTAFPDISPSAWEHPADRATLSILRQIPGFDQVLKVLSGFTSERSLRLIFLGSSLKVTPLQLPKVHALLQEAASILDVSPVPELFISNDPRMNARAIGMEKPFLVLHSALLDRFSDEELLSILAHELAHVKAGHTVYRTLLWLILNLSFELLPIDQLVRIPILLALKDWERKSELSCDRAGVLVVQDPQVYYQLMAKMVSGGQKHLDLDELIRQADEYESSGDLLDSVYKVLSVLEDSHPLLLIRLKETRKWILNGEYEKILTGTYRKLGDKEDPADNAKSAFTSWEEDLRNSSDPGAKLASQMVDEVKKAGEQLQNFIKDIFPKP